MVFSSPVGFGGLTPLVGESESIMAEFTIGGVAVYSAVKGVTTQLRNLGGGCCKLRTTRGVNANVTLVWVLISEDTPVTTFSGLVAAFGGDVVNNSVQL